jgi:broad specificity phosphatase PhoE
LAPFERPGRPAPVILPGLREVDFGDWTGLSWQAVQEKYGVSPYAWLDLLTTGTMPKAETAAQWRQRVAPCLEQILRQHPGQKVAVFCHGGVIRLLLAILLDLPLPSLVRFAVDYASVTQVHCNERGASLQLLNFTPWKAQRI